MRMGLRLRMGLRMCGGREAGEETERDGGDGQPGKDSATHGARSCAGACRKGERCDRNVLVWTINVKDSDGSSVAIPAVRVHVKANHHFG
ncbi:hypothetical protein GCM10017752_23800 [Streptomyces roseoviridis]